MRRPTLSEVLWCGLSLLVGGCGWRGGDASAERETRVLVVATVHAQHRRNPNYTYQDIVRILDTYDPDVVCVEIRPEDFRKRPYLKEMMLATTWGVARGRRVCGFDWYEGSGRQVRAQLQTQPAYIEKARVFDSLVAANPITARFEARYGDYWSGEMDYRFYNGVEYNRYFEEWYRLSLAVYGDSPINLYYESRNRRMMDLAWQVIQRHSGEKVVLLTGAEHKHYFDRDLAARENVTVVELENLLPLVEHARDPAITAFLREEDDLPYYESGYPQDTSRYYQGKLTELVHGPDMDWLPDIIPARNVEMARKVLDRWRATQPVSPGMEFDEAWVLFLSDDCEAAIDQLVGLTEAIERGAIEDPFIRVYTYRNLGLCFDVLERRQDALRSYARARALMRGTRMERNADLSLRDYETLPYRRGRAAEPWRRNP